jgi:hypothetical protein
VRHADRVNAGALDAGMAQQGDGEGFPLAGSEREMAHHPAAIPAPLVVGERVFHLPPRFIEHRHRKAFAPPCAAVIAAPRNVERVHAGILDHEVRERILAHEILLPIESEGELCACGHGAFLR